MPQLVARPRDGPGEPALTGPWNFLENQLRGTPVCVTSARRPTLLAVQQLVICAPDGRVLSPLSPSRGLAVFFSSGWENMHQVAPVLSGTRFAVPAFFVTKAADADATADIDDDAATADALWRSLLRPESEADFKQIFARWHALLARGCEV